MARGSSKWERVLGRRGGTGPERGCRRAAAGGPSGAGVLPGTDSCAKAGLDSTKVETLQGAQRREEASREGSEPIGGR